MGIKTRFNPMGGRLSSGNGDISEWYYNIANNGDKILRVYAGFKEDVIVPKKNTIIQDQRFIGTKTYIYNTVRETTILPTYSYLTSVPDHIQLQPYSGIINVTNSKGTISYNTNDSHNFEEYVLLPTDWTQIDITSGARINFYAQYNSSPFYNDKTITSVNLQQVPFANNSMANVFRNCYNLISISGLNQDVTNMVNTFSNCTNFNQNIQIPSGVPSLASTFSGCTNFNQNIQIPSRVTNMLNTFRNCTSFNQNVQIPSGVTTLVSAFSGCTSFNQAVQIPSSVTNMYGTFFNCHELYQNIQIPNGVTNIVYAFGNCNRLQQHIQIPYSITNMSETFEGCTSLKGANIYSYDITCAANCFNNTTGIKQIWLPYRYINNTLSVTRNSFNSAGYIVGTGVGNSTINGCVMYDYVASQGYPTYFGNGTHWILNKYTNASAPTSITVPNQILDYPTSIDALNCFKGNTTLKEIDCNNVPFAGTTCINAFRSMTVLKYADNINIPDGTTTMASMFYDCRNLQRVTSVGRPLFTSEVNISIPNTVTTLATCFVNDKNISYFYLYNGFNVTTLTNTFALCNARAVNVRLESPNIATITNWFRSHSTSYRKNIYIYFKYKNGVATKTFNAFKAATYMGTSGNSTFANPSYNSTSNFYFYNIGVCPV